MSVLHVESLGAPAGTPVLALHGVTGHATRWRVLAERLPGVRFVAVDLRGHGRSEWTPPWNLEQHVADAVDTLDHLGLAAVPVLGHSFGATVALHLARTAPRRVERLVLLDPALGLDPADMLDVADQTCPGESYPDRAAARVERARRWAAVADEIVDAEIDEHLVPDGDRWRYRYSTPAVVAAWGEMARPTITPPAGMRTLLMPAAKEDYVSPAWVERLRAELGDLLTVAEVDAGHMVYLERPDEVAATVGAFLAGGLLP